jgi:hypothetical protein
MIGNLDNIDKMFLHFLWDETFFSHILEDKVAKATFEEPNGGFNSWEEIVLSQTDTYVGNLVEISGVLIPNTIKLLEEYRVFVVPNPFFDAYSTVFQGRPYIVIHSGVFDILSYSLELNIIASRILDATQETPMKGNLLFEWIMEPGTRILYRVFQEPSNLPYLRNFFDDEMNCLEFFLLSCQELFILFHEIAHHRLGHIANYEGDQNQIVGVVDSAILTDEFEADSFAFHSMSPLGIESISKPIIYFFTTQAYFEYKFGTIDHDHPQALDRLENIIRLSGDTFSIQEISTYFSLVNNDSLEGDVNESDTNELIDELLLACSQAYKELEIEFDDIAEREADVNYYKQWRRAYDDVKMIFESPEESIDTEKIVRLVKDFFLIEKKWEIQKNFIMRYPEVISDSSEKFARMRIIEIENSNDHNHRIVVTRLQEFVLLIRHCNEYGIENARPVLDIFFNCLIDGDYRNLKKFSIKYPGFLCQESIDCIERRVALIRDEVPPLMILEAELYLTIMKDSVKSGIDEALSHLFILKEKQKDFWTEQSLSLAFQLALAIKEKNLSLQREICLSAIKLSEENEEIPLWLIHFQTHLDKMPSI